MAWCPKCKNEYREGIKVCADCKIPLVDYDPTNMYVLLLYGEENHIKRLNDFLNYNRIYDTYVEYSEKNSMYELMVLEEEMPKAMELVKLYLKEETKEEIRQNHPELEEALKEAEEASEGTDVSIQTTYQTNQEKAADNRSSAWVLLSVGILGILVLVLAAKGILPISFGKQYLFYAVMGIVFLLFIILSFVSFTHAKKLDALAESEDSLQESLLAWCKENLQSAEIDARIYSIEHSKEAMYFYRYEAIKDKINNQFINLDQKFLDRLIDEKIYDMVYSDKEQ